MKKTIVLLFFIFFPNVGLAAGLDEGDYMISFRISDMGYFQKISLQNFTHRSSKTSYFDVVIEERGTLNPLKFRQVVKGKVDDTGFYFIIPDFAHYRHVFYFIGVNKPENGTFNGIGDVPFQGPNGSKNKYKFEMKKLDTVNNP